MYIPYVMYSFNVIIKKVALATKYLKYDTLLTLKLFGGGFKSVGLLEA